MNENLYSVIIATGSYIPAHKVPNSDFLTSTFHLPDGQVIDKPSAEILQKFENIAGIRERRYITENLTTSDIAFFAAEDALLSSKVDKETLDYIIIAHNFGDVKADNKRSDIVPSLAARVKQKLGIINPKTVAYDICFGCPGWLQGLIQANYYLKSGDAKRAMVIGAEALSRISDPYDRDSLLYADGAGAVIVEAVSSLEPVGILSHATRSDTLEHAFLLSMGTSNNPDHPGNELYLKMNGHKLYEYALNTVPKMVEENLQKTGLSATDVDKILLHQANDKMDMAIVKRLFKLYGQTELPPNILPMTIGELGNTSVATIPTMLDLILKGNMRNHQLNKDNIVIFASVGAGMNINSMIYKMP